MCDPLEYDESCWDPEDDEVALTEPMDMESVQLDLAIASTILANAKTFLQLRGYEKTVRKLQASSRLLADIIFELDESEGE